MEKAKTAAPSDPKETAPETLPGGARPATPGEEGVARRHMRIRKINDPKQIIGGLLPAKGLDNGEAIGEDRLQEGLRGPSADGPGRRAVYVLARAGEENVQSPILPAGPSGEDAVAVFGSREKAVLFLQVARWDGYEVLEIAPPGLEDWIADVRSEGIEYVVVDVNRHDEMQGKPQPTLSLKDLPDQSGENLFNTFRGLARP